MAIDIQNFFNSELPARVAANEAEARALNFTVQMNVTGDGGGEWFIDLKDGMRIQAGNPGGAGTTVTVATEDFQKYIEDPQRNGMQLLFAGKLKVTGDQTAVMKLPKLFNLGR